MEQNVERVNQKRAGLLIRLVFLTVVYYLIFSKIDWPSLLAEFRNVSIAWFIIGLVTWSLSIVIGTMRWQVLLSVFAEHISLRPLLAFHFVGIFYGQFLPGSIASDMVKGLYLVRTKAKTVEIVASTLVDRLVGLVVTGLLAMVALSSTSVILDTMAIEKSTAVIGLFIIVTGAFLGMYTLLKLGKGKKYWPEILSKTYEAFATYFKHFFVLIKAAGISFIYFFTWSTALWMLARSVNIESTSLWDTILILATVNTVQLLPISINGWGIREGVLISMLALYNVPSEQALVYSLLIGSVAFFFGVLGGVIVLVDYRYKGNI